ncbi:sensor histidine kinase [Lachnobacterium bovis]|uniref:HAMP domain-containing sensor histidine kinase n=1 Tax=Lachnobacterium bovis TaxID=140626 RepID=UPI0003B3A09F|nr:HAMP domain-containing sensor histidine kinase [Lachnobacterium bovis]
MEDILKKKRAPLTIQLIVTMVGLVAGTVLLCAFINSTCLEHFYIYKKESSIIEGFKVINKAANDNYLSSSKFDIQFESLCANKNLTIAIVGSDKTTIRSSSTNESYIFMQINDMIYGDDDNAIVLKKEKNYVLQRRFDDRMNAYFLTLYGKLNDGSTIFMRTPLESIRESAQLTNFFFECVGGMCVIGSTIIIIFISKRISRPILQLSKISKEITNLNFDAKYNSCMLSSRETDELGNNMNILSDTLQRVISELKEANNELMRDLEKKEKIDEMRKEFLSNVSHELKTPLALIQGYAEGLKECINDDPESKEYYSEVIIDEAAKMNKMVQKLLTLNQLEFGNDMVEMKRFDLKELVDGIVSTSSLMASQNGITITFDEDKPVYVWGDEFKVEEVISNFLSNAIHYAKYDKKIEINIEAKEDVIRTTVFNTGDLIPEEEIEKVWIKFYKVDKARTREYGGSGIGLSIVKAIMDSFRQKCGVENRENGVAFWMELQRA